MMKNARKFGFGGFASDKTVVSQKEQHVEC